MTLVTLVVHRERRLAAQLAAEAVELLSTAGVDVAIPTEDAHVVGLDQFGASDDRCRQASVAVSLGGDGTMLRTVALVAEASVAVLGVNVGLLGYLTEIEPVAMAQALRDVLAGRHHIEERMMLAVTVVHKDGSRQRAVGLNEVVIEKAEPGHMVRLLPSIDGALFTPYAADGLIVATPTGSTAYAMSARGPILSPALRALVLTPVSPHMLFDRSLVLTPDESIEIALGGHRPATVAVDGRHLADLVPGDHLEVGEAPHPARLARLGDLGFHQRLKAKFQLADR